MFEKRRVFALALLCLLAAAGTARPAEPEGWALADVILARIQPPRFADRDVDVRSLGAVADGQTDSTLAFQKAIARVSAQGGGRVVVPPGTYVTGAIHLKSNVNLHVAEGATILFHQDPAAFLPNVLTRFEGVECWNYSPLIYAHGQRNVAVTGKGVLDGRADNDHWWPWKYGTGGQPSQKKDRDALFAASASGVPVKERVFGAGHYLRPSFIQTYDCDNVLIEGVTLKNAPMWFVHPVLSRNVIIRNVTTIASGPNTDGANPESCRDVLIEGCLFDTGDDCIALKSGRNEDGRRLATPIENVIIRRCQMKSGHGGITIGSEMSGGARNIFAEDTTMSSPELDRGLRIKTNSVRGGYVENLFVRNVTIGEVREAAIRIDMFYEEGDAGPNTPVVRNIDVRNLSSAKSRYGLYLTGYDHAPIRKLRLTDCAFNGVAEGNVVRGATEVTLTNVTLNGQRVDATAPDAPVTRPWSVRMVESSIARNPDALTVDTPDRPRWNYTQGLQFHAILEAWRRTGEARYFDYVKRFYDSMVGADGSIQTYRVDEFNIDRINGGRPLFALYEATKEEKYRRALDLLRSQMSRHPRTSEGGFWHKQIYPHQMWLDGLYMGSPFLAQYGQMFGQAAAGDDAALQCVLMEKRTRDPGTGLLYHGWDESRQQRWCDPATGLSKQFWGRAMGWYAMALVDVLDFLPESHPRRAEIVAEVNRVAEAIVRFKDPFDEVWYQVLDQPTRQGNYQESSVSTMFVYTLLKGVRKGYLDKRYLPIARKAYEGIIGRFIEVDAQGQVHIHKVCIVAGLGGNPYRDGSYEYYVSTAVGSDDPKAVGPFILASLEFEALAR